MLLEQWLTKWTLKNLNENTLFIPIHKPAREYNNTTKILTKHSLLVLSDTGKVCEIHSYLLSFGHGCMLFTPCWLLF